MMGSSSIIITTQLSPSLRCQCRHRSRRFCSMTTTTMILSLIVVSLMTCCCVAIEQQQQQQQTSETDSLDLDEIRRRKQQLDDYNDFEKYIDFDGFGGGGHPRNNNNNDPPTSSNFRVPDTYKKLRDSDIERGSDKETEKEEEDKPEGRVVVEEEKEENDDDYSVTILDDEVPWTDDDSPPPVVEEVESRPLFDEAQIYFDDDEGPSVPFFDEAMIFDEPYADDYYRTAPPITTTKKPTSPPSKKEEVAAAEVLLILEDDVPWDDIVNADIIDELASNASQALEALEAVVVTTIEPTITPYPTIPPTKEPSLSPTISYQPSLPVTDQPSILPSDYPSMMPTDQPSLVPTNTPTDLCHDLVEYRSPINNLTCAAHTNTNCLAWRFVGLNITELQELVDSCPQTCNIECDSFSIFSAPVSFRISRVSGFMDPSDVDSLSDFALQYVEDFVRAYIGSSGSSGSGSSSSTGGSSESDESSSSNDNNKDSSSSSLTTGDSKNNTVDKNNDNGNIKDVGDGGDDSFEYKIEQDDFLNDDVVVGDILMFEIENIVLTSQNLVEDTDDDNSESDVDADADDVDVDIDVATGRIENNNSRSLRSRRALQKSSGDVTTSSDLNRLKKQSWGSGSSIIRTDQALDVIITFEGFIIGMNPDTMSELIVLGIDSIDFTRELQRSSNGDFFMYASVSSAMETVEEDILKDDGIDEDDEKESNTKFTTTISFLVPILVFGFFLGSCVYHRYFKEPKRWVPFYQSSQIGGTGGRNATPLAANNDDDAGSGRFFDDNDNEEKEVDKQMTILSVTKKSDGGARPDGAASNSNGEQGGGSYLERILASLSLTMSRSRASSDPDTEESKIDEEELHEDTYNSEYMPDDHRLNNTERTRDLYSDDLIAIEGGKLSRKSLNVIGDGILRDTLVSPMSDGSDNSITYNNSKNHTLPTIPICGDDAIDDINDVDSSDDDDSGFNMYASVLPPMIIIDNIDVSNDDIDISDPKTPISLAKNSTSTVASGIRGGTPLPPSSQEQAKALDKFASEFREHLLRRSTNATTATRGDSNINNSGSQFNSLNSGNGGGIDDSPNTSFRGSFYDAYSSASYEMTAQRGSGVFGPIKKKKNMNRNKKTPDATTNNNMLNERGHEHDSDVIRNLVSNLSEDYNEEFLMMSDPRKVEVYQTANSNDDDEPHRRRSSFSAIDDLDRSTASPSHSATAKKSLYGTWDAISPPTTTVVEASVSVTDGTSTNIDRLSIPTSAMNGSQSEENLSSGAYLRSRRRGSLPPKRPPTPERYGIANNGGGHRKNNSNNSTSPTSDNSRKSAFSFASPFSRTFATGGSVDSDGHKRKSSDTSDDLRVVGNSSNLSAITFTDELLINSKSNREADAVRLEFVAPRKGNWGLVLESSTTTGPMIYAVKEYSPLFGLVQKGDKLLEIDGKNVSQSGVSDVTKLLKGKSSSSIYHRNTSTSMPIVILRRDRLSPIASFAHNNNSSNNKGQHHQKAPSGTSSSAGFHHQRNSSYGSASSLSNSRIVEDVDDIDLYDPHHHHQQYLSNQSKGEEI